MSSQRPALEIVSLGTILFSTATAASALASYPAYFDQPASRVLVSEIALMFAVYLALALYIARRTGTRWDEIRKNALFFAYITGAIEIAGIVLENYTRITAPAVSISLMLTVFTLWGIAGLRTSRHLCAMRPGLLTASISAGVCMLIAVAAGFLIEFYLHPPAPDSVLTWAEYIRSGWTDPRAFVLANTLESGITHLLIAPFVALVFAGILISLDRAIPSLRRMTESKP